MCRLGRLRLLGLCLEGLKIGVIVGFSIIGFWVLLLFFLCYVVISWLLWLIVSRKNTFALERITVGICVGKKGFLLSVIEISHNFRGSIHHR